jgi:hypothetical protein
MIASPGHLFVGDCTRRWGGVLSRRVDRTALGLAPSILRAGLSGLLIAEQGLSPNFALRCAVLIGKILGIV